MKRLSGSLYMGDYKNSALHRFILNDRGWYEENGIALVAGDAAAAIDRSARVVVSASGRTAGYDKPANGNNVLDIRVFARYTRTHDTSGACITATGNITSCSEAYVGKRTLVIEPVHAANREQSEPTGAPPIGSGGL